MALILFPTKFEAEPFIQSLDNAVKYDMGEGETWVGESGRTTVHVVIIGMGLPHCVNRAKPPLELVKGKRVFLAGFAGALDPALQRGEIVTETGEGALGDGKIYTADKVINTPEAKAQLFAQTGKPVVDMESAHVAKAAEEAGKTLTIIRGISDTAAEPLPDFLSKGYDQAKGKETPLRMAGHMATHPGDIGKMKALLASWEPVRKAIAEAVTAAVADGK